MAILRVSSQAGPGEHPLEPDFLSSIIVSLPILIFYKVRTFTVYYGDNLERLVGSSDLHTPPPRVANF